MEDCHNSIILTVYVVGMSIVVGWLVLTAETPRQWLLTFLAAFVAIFHSLLLRWVLAWK